MVMHGQNELLDLFLGGKNNEVITNVFDQVVEREQQLDDIIDPYDDMSLLRGMGFDTPPDFSGDICSEVEVVSEVEEIPQEATELVVVQTPYTSQSDPGCSTTNNQTPNFFQFPSLSTTEEFTTIDLQSFLNDVVVENECNQLDDSESTVSYTPLMPTSPAPSLMPTSPAFSFMPTSPASSLMPSSPAYSIPQTPDTASSLGSSSGNVPSFVKQGLKLAIKSKRQREGKGDLKVEFVPPRPEQLTEEEEFKRIEKREKNKYAAQKCREKKRARADVLEAETKKLYKEQSKFKLEIQKLLDEREHLMDVINVHRSVCPKFRSKSSAM